ncbi:MAG: hypothetical protein ACJATE_002061 [Bacteroidia bacterium]|jgi:hypothetical protein
MILFMAITVFLGMALLPFVAGVFFLGLRYQDKPLGKFILTIYKLIATIVAVLILTLFIYNWLTSRKEIERADVYGNYVIDRDKFSGLQAEWQYEHFRYTILPNDSIYFYETNGQKIIRTHKGTVRFLPAYKTPRLVIQIDAPRHHIVESLPTLYREPWSFYYVFSSRKFGNVFFTKGEWKPK